MYAPRASGGLRTSSRSGVSEDDDEALGPANSEGSVDDDDEFWSVVDLGFVRMFWFCLDVIVLL